jgi:hypothetical protein
VIISIALRALTGSFETDTKRASREADKEYKKIAENARKMGVAVGAAFAAAAIAGTAALTSWTRELVRTADEVRRFSRLTGASEVEFQRLAAGARLVGIEQEKLADIYKDTLDKVGDFIQNGGGPLKDFFDNIAPQVGVTAAEFRNLSGPEALGLYVRSLEQANLSNAEMVFYLEAIASDASLLLPLLKDNSRGFREAGDEAERLGAVLDEEALAGAQSLREEMVRLDLVFQGIKNEVAGDLAPAIADLAQEINSPQFRDGFLAIAEGAANAAKFVAELVGAVGVLVNNVSASGRANSELNRDQLISREVGISDDIKALEQSIGTIGFGSRDRLERLRGELVEVRRQIDLLTLADNEAARAAEARRREQENRPVFDPTANIVVRPGQATIDAAAREEEAEARRAAAAATREQAEAERELQRLRDLGVRASENILSVEREIARETGGPVVNATLDYIEAVERLDAIRADLLESGEAEIEQLARLDAAQAAYAERVNQVIAAQEREKQVGRKSISKAVEEDVDEATAYADEAARNIQGIISNGLTNGFKGGFKGLLDEFGRVITQILAEIAAARIAESLFGGGANGGKGSKGGGGWGDIFGSILGAFAGGRANGGTVLPGRFYQVNERGPEMFSAGGKDYLMMGSGGGMVRSNRSSTVNQTINVSGRVDRRTASQLASESARRQRVSTSRFG